MMLRIRYFLLSPLLSLVLVAVESHHAWKTIHITPSEATLVVDEGGELRLEHIEQLVEPGGVAPEVAVLRGPTSRAPQPQTTVSEVVPVYNEGAAIPTAIRTALKNRRGQKVSELIVIDDASGDDTLAALMKFKHRNFSVVRTSLGVGLNSALEIGATVAKGQVVLLTDLEVLPHITDLQPIIKPFEDESVGIVVASRHLDQLVRGGWWVVLGVLLVRLIFRYFATDIGSPLVAYRTSLLRGVVGEKTWKPITLRALLKLAVTGGEYREVPFSECVAGWRPPVSFR